MIPRRRLGACGIEVPALGLGVSGPHGSRYTNRRKTEVLIHSMIEAGAGLFDTAPTYGEAEARLGAALRGRPREAFVVATKVGTVRGLNGLEKDFSPGGVRQQFEGSLRALGLEHVDLLLVHGPDPVRMPPLLETLAELKRKGLVRAIGVCARGTEVEASIALGFVEVVQAPVFENRFSQLCQGAGIGFLGMEALRGVVKAARLPGSRADLWYMARTLAQHGLAGLREGPRPDESAEKALRKALARPGVNAIIMTTTRLSHLKANLAIAESLAGEPRLLNGA